MMTSLNQVRDAAVQMFAADSAVVEIEFTMIFGSVWIGRDLQIFDHARFAE